ncbi:MAG TPA: hypothetical protein VL095_14765 [Flavisolibacter sp.]|nr:hypothetical protein [Flavisolibacter sp.]
MKKGLVLFGLFLTIVSYSQEVVKDTTLKVVYANRMNNNGKPAFYINEKFAGYLVLDPNVIDNIRINKGEVQVDGTKYNGQIFIQTKSNYTPKLISLLTLKVRYTNLANKPAVFMIDGEIVNTDYDKFVVDENYVLQIIVDGIKNEKENIDLNVIKLLTKTEENIKRSKEIRIKGVDVTMN